MVRGGARRKTGRVEKGVCASHVLSPSLVGMDMLLLQWRRLCGPPLLRGGAHRAGGYHQCAARVREQSGAGACSARALLM